MGLEFSVDFAEWRRGARELGRNIWAVRQTLAKSGRGEIFTKRRKKLRGERQRAVHGRVVANVLASRGHPVDQPTERAESQVWEMLERRAMEALTIAGRTGREQSNRINAILLRAAEILRDDIVEYVSSGRAGTNAVTYGRVKRAQADHGAWWVTEEYGSQPIYGVRSGRYLGGLSARLGRGPKRRSTVY